MVYNLSLAGNNTGLLTIVQLVNDELMFGWFGALFLIGLAIVLFSSFMFKSNDIGKSATTTAFIIFTLSLSLRAMGLLSNLGMFITVMACAISVATTWKAS